MESINLGLCCINTVLRKQKPPVYSSRSMILKSFETKGMDHLKGLIRQNLKDTIKLIEWNYQHNINLFRLSSDLFPHKSNPKAPSYTFDFALDLLTEIGETARKYNQRLTFHPGQYDVLATPDPDVLKHTIDDLAYHAEVLDLMGMDSNSVMVIHGGGVYGNKCKAKQRFCKNFKQLPENIRSRLVLENCEKNFSIIDCLEIADYIGIPIVFDTHHFDCYQQLHPDETFEPASYYIPLILETWGKRKPKFHVSEQGKGKRGHHSDFIEKIPDYLLEIPKKYNIEIDIMIEAKMKEQAILKLYNKYSVSCIRC
jgi:UV DNA damage endonuclease